MYALAQRCGNGDCTHLLLKTADGEVWSGAGETIDGALNVRDFAAAGSNLIAVGNTNAPPHDRAAIWRAEGESWLQAGPGSIFAAGADGGPARGSFEARLESVVHGPLGWLAGGWLFCTMCAIEPGSLDSRYTAWVSADGANWTRQPWHAGPGALHRVAAGRDRFVAIDGISVWSSTDAEFWDKSLSVDNEKGGLVDVAAGEDGYIAIGQHLGAMAVWTSSDGVTWDEMHSQPAFDSAEPRRVVRASGRWVVVGAASQKPNTPYVPTAWTSWTASAGTGE